MTEPRSTFCILPWVHSYVDPVGDVFPCCVRAPESPTFGDVKTESLASVWNSEAYKKFRRDLLTGQPRRDVCQGCYTREKTEGWSHRTQFNEYFKDRQALVEDTQADGHLEKMELAFIDFRLSNVCNFKCRSCGPESSTSWQADYEALGLPPVKPNHSRAEQARLFDLYLSQLPTVKRIYFAGGEPLLVESHYRLLEKLIELKRFDVRLEYNTNLSRLKFGNRDVVKLWQQFNDVHVWPSVDHIGAKAEYVRHGTKWPEILTNISRLRKEVPHVNISPNITVSIFNVLELESIVEGLLDVDLIPKTNPNSYSFNILRGPSELHVSILTADLKKTAEARLRQAIERKPTTANRYAHVLEHVLQPENPAHRRLFLERTEALDRLRSENFFELFPEMRDLQNNGQLCHTAN